MTPTVVSRPDVARRALGAARRTVTLGRRRLRTVARAVGGLPVWPALARLVRPVTEVVTPTGWAVLVGAVAAGVAGLRLGWLELVTLAVLLATVAAVGLAFLLGQASFAARIDLDSTRVRVGDRVGGEVVVANPTPRPLAGERIEVPVGRNTATFRVPRLAAGEQHTEAFEIPGRRRGVIPLGPVRSVRADPLGIVHRQRDWTEVVELFVHPETVPLDPAALGFLKDVEGVATQSLSSSDVAFHALRDYVPGDDRRAIHWRTTARLGTLIVRQFEETMRAHLLLVLSLRPHDYRTLDDFELAVSAVASVGRAAIADQRQVSVVTSAGRLEVPSGVGLLDALCRVAPEPGAAPLRDLAATATALVPDASVSAFVTGQLATPADLRAAQVVLPAQVSTFAVRCGVGVEAARRRAAGLTVLDIGSLADLQRGLRGIR